MTKLVRLGQEDGLRAVVAPWRGAKIVSLVDGAGREWLAPRARARESGRHGGAFVDAEMGGWDECAPTIDETTLPDGTVLRDHGDLWDQPWACTHTDAGLVTEARGRDWPYTLRRTLAVDGRRLRLEYRATSHDTVTRPFLWAAHPQFLAPSGSRVQLPGVDAVVRTQPGSPQTTTWDPSLVDLPAGRCAKWWTLPGESVREAALVRPDGARLTVRVLQGPARWMGVWSDAHVWSAQRVVALEPATGWYDDAARALDAGRVLLLDPGAEARWTVEVEVGG